MRVITLLTLVVLSSCAHKKTTNDCYNKEFTDSYIANLEILKDHLKSFTSAQQDRIRASLFEEMCFEYIKK